MKHRTHIETGPGARLRGLLGLGLAALAPAVVAAAPPPPRAADTPLVLTGLRNPGFEGGLQGWTATGDAFSHQPTLGDNVVAARVGPVTVGGSYWTDLPFPIGIRGQRWIGTKERRPSETDAAGATQGDGPRGTLTSHAFRMPEGTRYISFLIGGGRDLARLKVELLEVRPGGELAPLKQATPRTGHDDELLRRDWWDVRALDPRRDYAIRVTDDASGPWGHINVDDFRFETEDPIRRQADGHPALLKIERGGGSVWVDYDAPLWGAADLHTHPMSHLSMGRKLMHGAPDVGSLIPKGTRVRGSGCNTRDLRATTVAEALGDCNATHGGWGTDNTCGDHIRAFALNVAFDSGYERRYGGCPEGQEKFAELCYDRCRPGFVASGPMCHRPCPAGFRDDGLHCAKPESYGRGAGYPLKAGELNLDGAFSRCRADHPGGCERHDLVVYPKCREGFAPAGCCVCSPKCPAGTRDVGVSCEKTGSYSRAGAPPPVINAHGDHPHAGYPGLVHWPHWSSKSHQQMFVDWIRRAHEGGLNLLVALAVNNELLAEVVRGDAPKDDKGAGDLQIDEIRAFIRRHPDFMREVQTPDDLRRAIHEGKLAVVVGVELDNIGDLNVNNPRLEARSEVVIAEIRRLHARGVRYIFPLHFADNVLGGVAVKGGLFNLSNRFARTRPLPIGLPFPPGFLYQVEPASDPAITYRLGILGPDGEWAHGLTFAVAKVLLDALGQLPFPPAFHATRCPIPRLACVPQFALLSSILTPDPEWDHYGAIPGGHVNARGLTPVGEAAIREMMRLGMIIDVDHMSDKAMRRTLEIAEEPGNSYPLISGHTNFRDLPLKAEPNTVREVKEVTKVNENLRSPEQLSRLGALGGMMGVGWAGGDASDFLHAYRHGLQHRRRYPLKQAPAFSLGSDINGFEETPRPRPGSRVKYGQGGDALRQYRFGDRTWDYNVDGVAHIGLYPDIFQDLRDLGMEQAERREFFSAVDAFARMWDTIARRSREASARR